MKAPLIRVFATFTLCAGLIPGQEFEVVSVKPNKSASSSSHLTSDQGMLTAINLSLRNMIVTAYGLTDYRLECPDWLSSERFDVTAKFPEALPKDREKYNAELRAMMQKMLADRFKLVTHRDRKTFSVYGLMVGKSGVKFREAPAGDPHRQNGGDTHYSGTSVSMDAFAQSLSRRMDLPVVDMTGLKGFYNLTLDWVPEPRQSSDSKGDVPESPAGPTLPVALQEQLGLRLETRKAPLEILVVDHAERVPTDN